MYLTNRFFQVMGFVVLLFALSYPFEILLPIAKVAVVIAAGLFVTDIFMLYGKRPNLVAKRTIQPILSLSDPNPVEVYLENKSQLHLHLNVEDELPDQLQRRDFQVGIDLSAGGSHIIQYEIRPLTRGSYLFGDVVVFVSTRLGIIERKLRSAQAQEVNVYPSIIQMKRYELRAMRQIAHETGIKKMRRIGHSYEFEQIKNYAEGDDYRSINWRASGRRGELMVNQYEDERSQQVYCVIDKSRVMLMPFEGLTLLDYAINCSLAISNIILKKQDKVGLLTFSDAIGSTIKAERDTTQLTRIMEHLYREKERAGESNYELLYEGVRRLINSRSLLILFTNFESSYALERVLPTLRRLNKTHLLVVVFFENTEIKTLAQEPVQRVADIYKQTEARIFLQEKKDMVQKLRHFGIQAVLTQPQDLTLNTINKYLELKSRGLI